MARVKTMTERVDHVPIGPSTYGVPIGTKAYRETIEFLDDSHLM